MKDVATIVVTYNRLPLLKEAIGSLRNQSFRNHQIIVINNGSNDGTKEWLEEQQDIITITQENCGGAGGFFTGLKYASENGYKYSWIMDDDIEADSEALLKLYEKKDFTEGFLSSRIVDLDGNQCNTPRISKRKSSISGEWTWGNNLNNNLIEIENASFVGVFLNNKICYEIGLPYKEYFIWGDDTEYTSRIHKKYVSFLVIDSIIVHKRKITSILSIHNETNKNRAKMFYYFYRNRIHAFDSKFKKTLLFLDGFRDITKLLAGKNFYKAKIVLKGNIASLFFKPKIKYPNK